MQHEAIIDMTSTMVDSPSPLLATSAKAGAAMVLAEVGRNSEARDLLAQVPRSALDYRDPHELAWLPGATFLSQAGVALNDPERSTEHLESLEPYRNEWVVWGSGFMCFGPVALRRAQAALVAGRADIAAEDLALARQEIVQSGARLFEPALLCAEADLSLIDGNPAAAVSALSEASDLCAELDLETAAAMLAARAMELAAQPGRSETETVQRGLHRDGAVWKVDFDGETTTVTHMKGLVVLEALLGSPGTEFHVLELAAMVDGVTGGLAGEPPGALTDASTPLLDAQAFSSYRQRVSDLRTEIDEAAEFKDIEREAAARREMEEILDQLQRATGLGGRSRAGATNAERARVRITKSIRGAIGRIGESAPKTERHLSVTVRTGAFCVYEPRDHEPFGIGQPWSVGPKN